MPEFGIRSTYSQCPFEILMYDHGGLISSGTAFFYEHNQKTFLITNWHNLSGRHFLTKEPLGNRTPEYIEAKLSTYVTPDGNFTSIAKRIDIYYDNYNPLWYEHSTGGSNYDVVAIPFDKDESIPSFMHNSANKINNIRVPIIPGNTVFIIGYPHGLSIGFGLPIWKSGYIASEPYYDITIAGKTSEVGGNQNEITIPAFFIDSLTRAGLSGSPVFVSYKGTWSMKDPYEKLDPDDKHFWERSDIALNESAIEFCGIYSGRINDKEDGAALGLCWKKQIIEEICYHKKNADCPHIR
ncbi:MAG: hypothetical protein AB7U85_07400 [Alphaproteobacteria bacterium]